MGNVEIADASVYCETVLPSVMTGDEGRKLENGGLVILPTQYRDTLCYSQESVEFVKYCREAVPSVDADLLTDGDVKTLSLNSIDIWMPIIWVANSVLLPVVVNLVSSYIHDKLKGHSKEKANVELEFLVERDGEKKMLSYRGDAEGLKDSFEKIDISKL